MPRVFRQSYRPPLVSTSCNSRGLQVRGQLRELPPARLRGSGARFLAIVGMGNGFADARVKLPHIRNHLPIVHPVDSLQGNHEVPSVLNIDDERVSIRHVPADGAALLSSLDRIHLEANLDVAVLQHAGSSSAWRHRMWACSPDNSTPYRGCRDAQVSPIMNDSVRALPRVRHKYLSCLPAG